MKEVKKIGAVIVSHGQVANELLAAAEAVVGDVNHIVAVSIGWHDEVESAKDEISRAMKRVASEKGVLLLTDMFGGTPTNIAAMFLGTGVEIITGVNLPMVIKIASQNREMTLAEMATEIETQGRESICCASRLLAPQAAKKDA